MRDMEDEHDKWFYDLGALAQQIESNYKRTMEARRSAAEAQERARIAQIRANVTRKRQTVVVFFVLFASLLLAYRSEDTAKSLKSNTQRIQLNQDRACAASLDIIRKFNAQQDTLVEIESKNTRVAPEIREARIKAYRDVRVLPPPTCRQ